MLIKDCATLFCKSFMQQGLMFKACYVKAYFTRYSVRATENISRTGEVKSERGYVTYLIIYKCGRVEFSLLSPAGRMLEFSWKGRVYVTALF